MEEKFDAIVVGAGPAGCACGIILAKAGVKTLVVERGKFPGAKNMWGGAFYGPLLSQLIPNFWEEAPVERYILRHKLSLLTQYSSFSAEFTTKKFGETPYNGFSLLRSKFDRWLASKVEQAGAIVASGLQADDLIWDEKGVAGIKAGGDDIPAKVVIACDGVNSLLAERAGIRGEISAEDVKLGVKEVIQVPKELIEQRFNLSGEEGLAWEFIGSFTQGIPGGAFIYTNKESLSVGIVLQLSDLIRKKMKADELLEEFKLHPTVNGLVGDGQLVEYSAHLIPTYRKKRMPSLCADGFLVAGDAAGFVLSTGLILEGANFAISSGEAAAKTVIKAKNEGDFSRNSLSYYSDQLRESFIIKDLETFKKASSFLKNSRLYSTYPEIVCNLAEKIYTNDGMPRRKTWKMIQESMHDRISLWQLAQDLIRMKRNL